MPDIDLGKAFARLEAATPRRESGRVTEVTGLVIRASVPGVRIGELVTISSAVPGGPSALAARRAAAARRVCRLPRRRDRADAAGRCGGHRPRFAGHAHQPPVLHRRVGSPARARARRPGQPDRRRRADRRRRRARVGRRSPGARSAVAPARQPAAAAGRARAGRVAHRRRGPARRPLRGLGRRQVDADGADRAPDRGGRERHRAGRRARPRGGRLPRGLAGAGGAGALRRRLRDQRRAQPGAAEGGVRGDRGRRVLPRPGPARAVHARFDHAHRARPARGRPRRRRAARPAGLPAQRVRAAAAAAGAHRQRTRADRSPRSTPCWSRAATWRSRSPTRCAASSTATSSCRATSPRGTSGPPSTCCRRCRA